MNARNERMPLPAGRPLTFAGFRGELKGAVQRAGARAVLKLSPFHETLGNLRAEEAERAERTGHQARARRFHSGAARRYARKAEWFSSLGYSFYDLRLKAAAHHALAAEQSTLLFDHGKAREHAEAAIAQARKVEARSMEISAAISEACKLVERGLHTQAAAAFQQTIRLDS